MLARTTLFCYRKLNTMKRKSYHARVQLDVADFLSELDESDVLVAIPRSGIGVLRRLLRYAERNINWTVSVIDDVYYNSPDLPGWKTIQANLARLEYGLMSVVTIEDLIESINGLCSCLSIQDITVQNAAATAYLSEYDPIPEVLKVETMPDVDAERCLQAQAFYNRVKIAYGRLLQGGEEMAPDWAFWAVGGILFAAFGVALPAAIVIGLCAKMFLESAANVDEIAYQNYIDNKDEIVKALYCADSPRAAADAVAAIIDSFNPPVFTSILLKTLYGPSMMMLLYDGRLNLDTDGLNASYCAAFECGGALAGCFDFCDADWTIDTNHAHLNTSLCQVKLGLSTLSGVGAYRDITPSTPGTYTFIVGAEFKPPWSADEEYDALVLQISRVRDNGTVAESWSHTFTATTDTWRTESAELDVVFSSGQSLRFDIVSVGGTDTKVRRACAAPS